MKLFLDSANVDEIKEATSMGIPVVAIVDSNTDPNKINYPIPANDDSLRTIQSNLIVLNL